MNEVGNGHRAPAEQPVTVLAAECPELATRSKHVPPVASRRVVDAWRRGGEQGCQHLGHASHRLAVEGIGRGILRAQRLNRLRAAADVVVEHEGATVEACSKHVCRRHEKLDAETGQVHVADDIGPKRPDVMRESRAAEAGMEFVRDGATPDRVTPLEHDRSMAALREVKRGDESIVTAA